MLTIAIILDVVTMTPFAVGVTVNAVAETIIDSGACGDNVMWEFTGRYSENSYCKGKLTISGVGCIDSYSDIKYYPWYKYADFIEEIIINDGIINISQYAFSKYTKLKKTVISDSVRIIGNYAFEGCVNLSEILIPNGVYAIGRFAFYNCKKLTDITIPGSVMDIDRSAFYYCNGLKSITLLNPNCHIADSNETINITADICGYKNSTAQQYSEKYCRNFYIVEGQKLIGDINNDSVINVSDSTFLQKQIANGVEFDDEMIGIADANGDGIVSVSDATLIQKYLAGAVAVQLGVFSEAYIEYSQVRDEVQSYLDDVTYDSSDYSVSSIADYVTNTSNNYCASCKLNIKQAGKLIVCDGGNGGIITTDSFAGDNYIYNLTPNAVSVYANIVDNKIVQSGTIKANGSPRMIQSASTYNVRDLGGWSCDGGTVKYGKLYRGGLLSTEDKSTFVDFLKVTDNLDLRWDSEVTGTSSVLGASVSYKHINGCWYGNHYNSNLKDEVKYVIDIVNNGGVLYFHCAGGADRTGTLAMILEAILGVSQSDIDKDYELTCFYAGVQTDESARRRNEHDWKSLIQFFDNYAGDTLQDRVVDYLVKQGISINDINAFRHNMIDGKPFDLTS